ncbi:hypothetical protein EYF80_035438 [Liparis tanakae]|uniref:Uncharacterized protein n=1 Tax=Liparis tanakae TaxID=230148 RepID=A0A4Z2GL94_9TELE|nr:hypothetical protein EYF80_035438 [Liparis tanakae]
MRGEKLFVVKSPYGTCTQCKEGVVTPMQECVFKGGNSFLNFQGPQAIPYSTVAIAHAAGFGWDTREVEDRDDLEPLCDYSMATGGYPVQHIPSQTGRDTEDRVTHE